MVVMFDFMKTYTITLPVQSSRSRKYCTRNTSSQQLESLPKIMSSSSCDKDQAFVWKVKNGELNDIKMYVEKEGVNVNKQIQGRYPLHYAADYGQTEVIEYLLSKGANVNAQDKYGISPLLSAIFEGHTEGVKMLLAKGADKSGKSPDGAYYIDCAEKDEIKALLK